MELSDYKNFVSMVAADGTKIKSHLLFYIGVNVSLDHLVGDWCRE